MPKFGKNMGKKDRETCISLDHVKVEAPSLGASDALADNCLTEVGGEVGAEVGVLSLLSVLLYPYLRYVGFVTYRPHHDWSRAIQPHPSRRVVSAIQNANCLTLLQKKGTCLQNPKHLTLTPVILLRHL